MTFARDRLPPKGASSETLLDAFLAYVADNGLTLYPAQEEAILELFDGKNVILNTPTGSGKSLVALALHFLAMARDERSFYTCPIKALASEKFFSLAREFGPEHVGLMTGDASVNRDGGVVCCTAEVLSNIALADGKNSDVAHVVMDEFHYYADKERGVAWQIPLLSMANTRFLLMSATLGDTARFEEALTKLNGRPTVTIKSATRPVPLDFSYRETPLHETIAELVKGGKYPVYLVNFTQRSAAEEAQNLLSVDFSTKEEKKEISAALAGARFDSPYGKEMQRFVRHGIGLHHAGLLPKYRLMVEKLAQRGMLKVISGTDTLGVGVNIPIRTVVFTKLCKFDGEKTAILTARDFHQISGRAGRKGFDEEGSVVAQAPEHVIENLRLEAKAGSDPAKKRKIVKKKPPEWGYVHWDKATFERLMVAPPEPLQSRFRVSHAMLLSVLDRKEDGGCMGVAHLIKKSHERDVDKRKHGRVAMQMVNSLVDAKIISFERFDDGSRRIQIGHDLQVEFSLHHALSLYLVETLALLDRESETYVLDVMTLVESVLENPEVVLQRQLDKLKTAKMAEMKAAGVEYEERIAELEKMEYPKPNRDFIYDTFNAFARKHPWVTDENIRPKSIAREMFETFASFGDYVKDYGLERVEGVLLRYLSDAYKTLSQSVPASAKTDDVYDAEAFLGALVRQVDSSVLDEWERMKDPDALLVRAEPTKDLVPEGSRDITHNAREFTVLVRNLLFRFIKAIAQRRWDEAAELVDGGATWTGKVLEDSFRPFFAEHAYPSTDVEARAPSLLTLEKGDYAWEFTQILLDPEEANDWFVRGAVDLEASRTEGRPIVRLKEIAS